MLLDDIQSVCKEIVENKATLADKNYFNAKIATINDFIAKTRMETSYRPINRMELNKVISCLHEYPKMAAVIFEAFYLYEISSLKNCYKHLPDNYHLEVDEINREICQRSIQLLNGMIEYEKGNYDRATFYFLRGKNNTIKNSYNSFYFAYANSVVPIYENNFELITNEHNGIINYDMDEFDLKILELDNSKEVFLLSADEKYIDIFLENFLSSVACTGTLTFLFAITSNNEQIRKIQKFKENYKFAYKIVNPPQILDLRSFSAILRYLLAHNFIRIKRRIIICDIDLQFKGSTPQIFKNLNDFDIYLTISENDAPSMCPWSKISALLTILNPTEQADNFLKLIRTYFNNFFIPNADNWGIDQNILGSIYQGLKEKESFGNCGAILSNQFTTPTHLKNQVYQK